jgi:hypothetical protein
MFKTLDQMIEDANNGLEAVQGLLRDNTFQIERMSQGSSWKLMETCPPIYYMRFRKKKGGLSDTTTIQLLKELEARIRRENV